MAEYIKRQAILDALPHVENDKKISLCGAIADFIVLVSDIPAADVAPVVHGKWLNFYNDFSCAECDRCGIIFEVTDNETDEGLWNAFLSAYRYCPNCGAKMDEEAYNGT